MTIDFALNFGQAALNLGLFISLIFLIRQQRKMKKMYDMHNKLYKDYQKLVIDLQVKTRELLGKQSDDA